jgi:hypothetical protein
LHGTFAPMDLAALHFAAPRTPPRAFRPGESAQSDTPPKKTGGKGSLSGS